MEIELAVSFLLLLALTFLGTVDMAFGQLSDVGSGVSLLKLKNTRRHGPHLS